MPNSAPSEYRPTLFDRYGPDAGLMIRALSRGVVGFLVALAVAPLCATRLGLSPLPGAVWVLVCSTTAGAALALAVLGPGALAGRAYMAVMVEGASTPYIEQFSQQQALIMQGRLPEALASFEAIMAEAPDRIDVRLRAAELYDREAHLPERAAELFRAVQRMRGVSIGDDAYATNRLADLLAGPLGQRGQAMGELRRLIDRYPENRAAQYAREALARMKESAEQDVP